MEKSPDLFERRSERLAFAGILLAGLALRILYFLFFTEPDRDYFQYSKWIGWIADGDPTALSNVVIPPLFFMIAAAVCRTGIPMVFAVAGINIVCGCALLIAIYFCVKKLFGRSSWAFFAMGIAAIHPAVIDYTTHLIRDPMALMLTMFCLLFLLYAAENGDEKFFFFAGALGGCGAQVRTETMECLILGAVVLAVMFFQNRSAPGRRFSAGKLWRCGAVFLGGFSGCYILIGMLASMWGANAFTQLARYRIFLPWGTR